MAGRNIVKGSFKILFDSALTDIRNPAPLIGTIACKPFFYHMTSLTIAGFCNANFVCDENNSTFSSVILPTDQCISYRFSAHPKSDIDEVAL